MRRVTIDPITRLEGHGKIEIFLDDAGNVADAFFQVPELRGFEKFCEGRPVEELPRITPRICGVCPGAHHIASTKTVDAVYGTKPTPTGKMLREIFYMAHMIHSHVAHFYALAAPDFVLGPDADPAERNILGVVGKVGLEAGTEVIKHRAYAQQVQELIGGKATHPVCGLPGGVSRPITEEERREILEKGKSTVEFARFSLKLFADVVLKNEKYVEIIKSDVYALNTHHMGLVDDQNRVNFYEGLVRVVDTEGRELVKFAPQDYLEHIEEHVEPWTYLKFPYLKAKGWHGLVDGPDSGIYRVAPLARLNAADGMATPLAQEAYEEMYATLGGKPVQATLAQHWARLIEILYAAEHWVKVASDPACADPKVRQIPTATPDEGVGIIEAPRGTLIHHYKTDSEGMVEKVNLIVATGHNHGPICISVKKAAQGLIKDGNVDQGLLNMVEMAFRAYDPCLACATHCLPGRMPLVVKVYDHRRELYREIRRA